MSDPRWDRIEAVFSTAMGLPHDEQEALVERECADDPDLRDEVLALLRRVPASERYLSGLAERAGLPSAASEPGDFVGGTAGPYRLVKLLGRGGMGAVYLGERREDGFTVQAAVKLVATGAWSAANRRRFLEERRILATLRHPNIARLFDGGFTDDGTPYFVMEYVEGLPIHEYCDRHRLTVTQRVELALQVCRAVSYAHRNFVIHRDLKPTNVLVTADGDVKLLDFGIARVLQDGGGDVRTSTYHPHPMTLAYASPEQVRGQALSTATDVYGLALLIYRLITGRHPYEVPEGSYARAERVISETDPTPPHLSLRTCPGTDESPQIEADDTASCEELARLRRASLPALRRQLSGDVGRVLLKALRKEPERRYHTVGELADDLRRALGGLPVSARPDTRWYLLTRFVSRHRVGVSMAALVTLLAVGVTGLGVRYTLTTRAQAARIAEEAATTQQVTDLLLDILGLAEPGEGSGDTLTVRAALERGVARQRDMLSRRPRLRAQMLEVMARAYVGLGMEVEATSLLQEALALRPETGELGDTVVAHTLLRLAHAYAARGRFDESLSFARQADHLMSRIGADSTQIALALAVEGTALSRLEHADSARALSGRALDILRRHAGTQDPRTLMQALAYATVLRVDQEPDSAEALYRSILARVANAEDRGGKIGAQTLNNLGYLLRHKGEYADAATLYRKALKEYRAWMTPTERLTTLQNLASAEALRGDSLAAARALEERLVYARVSWPRGSWRVGDAALSVGRLSMLRGRYGEAEPYLREALKSFTRMLGPHHGWTANAESLLGSDLALQQRYDEAETLLVGACDELLSGPGPRDRWTVASVRRLADFYDMRGRRDEAARYRAMIRSDS